MSSRVCKRCGGNDFYLNRNKQCLPCTQARRLRYYAEDPTRRVINACQARLRVAHKELGRNVFGWRGCSKQELLRHLEEHFEPGMTWGTFGGPQWNTQFCSGYSLRQSKHCFRVVCSVRSG